MKTLVYPCERQSLDEANAAPAHQLDSLGVRLDPRTAQPAEGYPTRPLSTTISAPRSWPALTEAGGL